MEEFLKFVAGIFEVAPSEISGDTRCEDFAKWDSLTHLRLILEVEEKYGVTIPIDKASSIRSLKDLYACTQA